MNFCICLVEARENKKGSQKLVNYIYKNGYIRGMKVRVGDMGSKLRLNGV